ncbi:MAG: 4Fe-4S dicluster domain-containing protein, partial [Candidatus Omnitrophota bacterium]
MLKFISREDLIKLLNGLKKEYDVYAPVRKNGRLFYGKPEDGFDTAVIGGVRASEPVKAFFSRARERVADGFKPDVPHAGDRPLAVIGVKACDLKGFKIQDFVFKNHDCADPFYLKLREQNLIISADCTEALDTCFCAAMGIKPSPEECYDLNLSEISGGFVAETGSPKGEGLAGKYGALFTDASSGQTAERDKKRAAVTEKVLKNIADNDVPRERELGGAAERNFESGIWQDEARTCVECGACNTICPTCHCFLLYDQSDGKGMAMARFRIWDSCMIKDFARVAGGAN